MVLIKVLKRRDASSVVVAVVVAMILLNLLQTFPTKFANWLTGLSNTGFYGSTPPNADWKVTYLYPLVLAILQLLILEVLGWIYIWLASAMKTK